MSYLHTYIHVYKYIQTHLHICENITQMLACIHVQLIQPVPHKSRQPENTEKLIRQTIPRGRVKFYKTYIAVCIWMHITCKAACILNVHLSARGCARPSGRCVCMNTIQRDESTHMAKNKHSYMRICAFVLRKYGKREGVVRKREETRAWQLIDAARDIIRCICTWRAVHSPRNRAPPHSCSLRTRTWMRTHLSCPRQLRPSARYAPGQRLACPRSCSPERERKHDKGEKAGERCIYSNPSIDSDNTKTIRRHRPICIHNLHALN